MVKPFTVQIGFCVSERKIAIRQFSRDHIQIIRLAGEDLTSALPRVAKLRIQVFRDYPYLYDGDLTYEADYLRVLSAAKDAIVVAAMSDGEIVGCATGSALVDQHSEFCEPLRLGGIDLASTYYFAESVLLPEYRGLGIGHAFFDLREAWADHLNYKRTCFCAVVRPEDHPLRPKDYRALDPFWRKRGYRKLSGVQAQFAWLDVDKPREDEKLLQFWIKELPAPAL